MEKSLLHLGEEFQIPKGFWEKVIQRWAKLLEDYSSIMSTPDEPDQGYWDNERSNLGFLVLALHEAGAKPILQEFSTERAYKQGNFWGRCDLYARYEEEDYYFEAKKADFPIEGEIINTSGLKHDLEQSLSFHLGHAKSQLQKIKETKEIKCRRLAVLFVVTYQSPNKWEENKKAISQYSTLLSDLYQGKDNFLVAQFIPSTEQVPEAEKYHYPGVFMIVENL
jgi:hypothetical protein